MEGTKEAGIVMADRTDIDFTYSLTDRVIRLSLGELAEFSGAKYDGDFSLSLEEAQRRKHAYGADRNRPRPACAGSGLWLGTLLDYVRRQGGAGVGVTLSSAQVAACRRQGLERQRAA
jgi:cyclopropane-fatty-acyl-phospholipid synthase